MRRDYRTEVIEPSEVYGEEFLHQWSDSLPEKMIRDIQIYYYIHNKHR